MPWDAHIDPQWVFVCWLLGCAAKPSLILREPKSGVPPPDRVTQAFVAQEHQTRIRLPLNMPGTCWVNMFIRGSHNQWPLQAAVIHKAIFQQGIARACTSHPEEAILHIASCIYQWVAVIFTESRQRWWRPPPHTHTLQVLNTTN